MCLRIYEFDWFYYVVCGSYCGVCIMFVWEYRHISFVCLQCIMGYEYFIYSIEMC